ncbi:MAG TPA: hypothetical protein VGN00_12135 [Puia sp.]|jgi:hypothetical protein
MKEVKKISFQGKEKQFGPFIPGMILFQDQLVLVYYQSLEDNSIKLSMAVIDPETLDEKPGKELYTISQRNVGNASNRYFGYRYKASRNFSLFRWISG